MILVDQALSNVISSLMELRGNGWYQLCRLLI